MAAITTIAGYDTAGFEWELFRTELVPLWHLIHDAAVTEIQVNGDGHVFVMRHGKLSPEAIVIAAGALTDVGKKIAARHQNARFGRAYPIVDARLPDNSRVALVHECCSVGGTVMTIRKFSNTVLTLRNMVDTGSLPESVAETLVAIIAERKNFLIAGSTNSGKTTLLGALARHIPTHERILLVEGPSEIRLSEQQRNVVRFEAKPALLEGGEITQEALCQAALRHSPNRIILGEVRRPAEATALLQALNTGHEGSISTIHADNCRMALRRFAHLIRSEDGMDVAGEDVAQVIRYAIHLKLYADGVRRVREVARVDGYEDHKFRLTPSYMFD